MSVLTDTAFNIGTASALTIPANQARKVLIIQNKHATQTVRVKFGADVVGTDVTQTQTISFGATPDAGAWALSWNGNASGSLADNISAANLQVALRLVTGLSSVTVSGSVGAGFVVTMTGAVLGVIAALPLMVVSSNTLTSSSVAVAVTVAVRTQGAFADGLLIPAANGQVSLTGQSCPIGAVYMLASGSSTRVEALEG